MDETDATVVREHGTGGTQVDGPATVRAEHYPRPQLVRPAWADLSGVWAFDHDDDDVGLDLGWPSARTGVLTQSIVVPYPPEASASGVGATGFHPVVWYRRLITTDDLVAAGVESQGDRLLLHFGAVDHRADVWIDGAHVGSHEGGQTPFTFDVTSHLRGLGSEWSLVVRAEDDPHDVGQPRGKQDWQLEPHGIWYYRTTGIWQPVWLEAVPRQHVVDLGWSCDLPAATVTLDVELSRRPRSPVRLAVSLTVPSESGTEVLAETEVRLTGPRQRVVLPLGRQTNGQAYESLLWSPEHPRLVDAVVTLVDPDGPGDVVWSYLGLRSVGWADGHLMLNDRPCYLRAVLAQGYWPDTLLAAPDAAALRDEVQLILDLGFNAARVHEKAEDPRFLYWADRLGLIVWGEIASAYEFSATAVYRTTHEWIDLVRRDASHPCILAWVPLNESWGIQHVAHDPAQLAYAQALYHLTRALDPSRPVISNDGWEHAVSDLWTVHDYSTTGAELAASYPDRETVRQMMRGVGPLGRRMQLLSADDDGQPVIVSEFGGISYDPGERDSAWGYLTAPDEQTFERLLREQFEALQHSPALAGFCYTQLSDTEQETNGLTGPDRKPKLPIEQIRSIVLGEAVDISTHRRPRRPVEQDHGTGTSTSPTA